MSSYLRDPNEWISQAEAARLRGVSRQAIALLVKKGRLPVFKIGGRLLVRRKEVEEFTPEPAGRPPKMSQLTDEICDLINRTSEEERRLVLNYLRHRIPLHPLERQWDTTAETILTAIARSSDLTLRGIRGILAEATFEATVLPDLEPAGWKPVAIVGDQAYDFLLERAASRVRIQVKLQRREAGVPKHYAARSRASLNCPSGTIHVVEVQKTRSGEKDGKKTRPYRFGDFDVLAVNLHPSTGDWTRFVYTVGNWLLPRPKQEELIEIFQPVPERPDEYWTHNLSNCIGWFLAGTRKRLYS